MPESLMHLSTVYGNRAKLEVIVPPTNTANEAEWNIMAPADVSINSARMPLHTDTTTSAATFWRALRMAGVTEAVPGFGTLPEL